MLKDKEVGRLEAARSWEVREVVIAYRSQLSYWSNENVLEYDSENDHNGVNILKNSIIYFKYI